MRSTDCESPSVSRAVLTSGLTARAQEFARSIAITGTIVVCLGSCDLRDSSPGPDVTAENSEHRPTQCSHLYDPGNTDIGSEWKRCMGVGPK